jgi:uncharacterized protein YqgC (DUF456 family)
LSWLSAVSDVFFPLVIGGVMLVGLVLTLTPIISGLWMMWAAALVYGLVTHFDTAGWIIFGVISILALVGGLLDNVFMAGSSRRSGASWLSIGAALLGALIGSILFPPFGGLLLAVILIFLAEYLRLKDWRQALESTKGLALGCGWAAITRFGFGLLILTTWLLWVLVFD